MIKELRSCLLCGDPMVQEAGGFGHTSTYQDALPENQRCILRHTFYPEELRERWNARHMDRRVKELEEALTFYRDEWRKSGDAARGLGFAAPDMLPTHALLCDYGERARATLNGASHAQG